MVYYRKYRPQTISELDSGKLRDTLSAVLSKEEVPHAFLLTGPKGLGKTSTARIIAKVVNCEHTGQKLDTRSSKLVKETGNLKLEKSIHSPVSSINEPASSFQHSVSNIEPDNTCEQCVSITNGNNLDVLEIDGASNRGIDEIRDLRDKVKLAPSRAKKKIYIIDEVHMLTTEAFNALLKTIEEPPAHVMFLFCTTEAQKVPETIVSRCFHVSFPKATIENIVHSLDRVVKGEKLNIDKDALTAIAGLADGGFRDAAKILEEIVLIAGEKKITKEFVENYYKVSSISYLVSSLLQSMSEKNAKEGLGIIGNLVEQGIDIKYFISQILVALHELLLSSLEVSPNTKYTLEDIQQFVALFSEAYKETKYAVIPQLPLELAVVVWCSQSERLPNEEIKMTKTSHPMDEVIKKEKNLKVQSILRGSETQSKKETKKENNTSQEKLSDKEVTQQFMENLVYKVKPINFSIAGVLRGCVIKKLADGEVVFETSYKFHKEKLNEGKTREILENAIKEITGKQMKIVIELKG